MLPSSAKGEIIERHVLIFKLLYTLATIELVAPNIWKVHAVPIHKCTVSEHLMKSILVALQKHHGELWKT